MPDSIVGKEPRTSVFIIRSKRLRPSVVDFERNDAGRKCLVVGVGSGDEASVVSTVAARASHLRGGGGCVFRL